MHIGLLDIFVRNTLLYFFGKNVQNLPEIAGYRIVLLIILLFFYVLFSHYWLMFLPLLISVSALTTQINYLTSKNIHESNHPRPPMLKYARKLNFHGSTWNATRIPRRCYQRILALLSETPHDNHQHNYLPPFPIGQKR